jgi:1-acyl-sn-glycerol-3-phosphate acyltransferase
MMQIGLNTSRFTQLLAQGLLHLLSWQFDVILPEQEKFVLIGAPHTSNWDLFYALLLMHASGIQFHWVAKDSAFRWPFGGVMRWLGGIPVNRRSANNFVQQVVETFHRFEKLVIAIAPEGTRHAVNAWKTGFYYIALGAQVPIAMGYIDYAKRMVGIGPSFFPSGDIHSDFEIIKAFYTTKTGKRPARQSVIQLRAE